MQTNTIKNLNLLVKVFNEQYNTIESVTYENPYTSDYQEDLHANEIIMAFEEIDTNRYLFSHNDTALLIIGEENINEVEITTSFKEIVLKYKEMVIIVTVY